ncbi:CoA-substrate-specific enzyme activase [Ruminiclostridium papyrosolvens DSM 2782]|uniref:CoA-substrate-specific enzyme activase n=1 Tax=Ruminiclostridium papyrosolvens DSM 2782 TaxID=588581 RepID=F1TC05_9FIRM|nr:acyl-CoA dehydratase activase [Ruminiclostridium papyrosolvens]EGD47920.1 CoA-substrate-specific enzyme activase [Ruminiclostridium papyrosolvens DSM 2782]WES35186.1 acyl-CoA dehydratase activase [Ruminiclostridium papyrosolvens DSM 2782]
MKILGIDLGSREVKIVLMDKNSIIHKQKISTMTFYKNYCLYKNGKLEVDIKNLGFSEDVVAVSTGYGRNNTDISKFRQITEIKAHVYGAIYQTDLKEFILLDVGGQDVKVIKVEKGLITDLEMNDKCAASCGRYLENMSMVLEIPLEKLTEYFEAPVELNSTCSVFSESELIGKIAEGVSMERLCAGVNYSLYRKLRPLLFKFKGKRLVMSGGVAKSKSLAYYLTKDFDEVIMLKEPQFNGAIGCCSYGSLF